MIRSAMFYINKEKAGVFDAVASCEALCREKGIRSYFFSRDMKDMKRQLPLVAQNCRTLDAPDPQVIDALFVFGGDGTVLRALNLYGSLDLPILGVNLGRMGFLLETEVSELDEALTLLAQGDYEIEHKIMLSVSVYSEGRCVSARAINEVSISRGLSQRMIALDALAGGMLVDHYIADGLVLASPTGSTAYSLSAGGPIVSPDVRCFVLNPICPHSLQSRPVVLSSDIEVILRVNMKEQREGICLAVDGREICHMKNHDEAVVRRSEHDALLIRFKKNQNFFSLLKEKLSQWSL